MKQIIFESIFRQAWQDLPEVFKKHYANRANTSDRVTVEGIMNIQITFLGKIFRPFMRLVGALVPYEGDNIPVTVHFDSNPANNHFQLHRIFHFPDKPAYHFKSTMVPTQNGVVEYMKYGIGWHASYGFENNKVVMKHLGYKLKIFEKVLPLFVGFIFGRGYAEEEALDENRFRMLMEIIHPLFGKVYSYSGEFKIIEMRLENTDV